MNQDERYFLFWARFALLTYCINECVCFRMVESSSFQMDYLLHLALHSPLASCKSQVASRKLQVASSTHISHLHITLRC